jgi:hypothetical protein
MSQVWATTASHPSSWSLGPNLTSALHRSRSVGTARPYLTFTSPSTTASKLHTCTTQAKRHVTHIAFTMVGLVTTQPSSWITLTITHHKTNHKGTFQPFVHNLPLDECISNTNTWTAWAKEEEEEEEKNKELNQMIKSQRKGKMGSFEMSKNLVPKDMSNDSTQPCKIKLALKKRQRAQHQ